jgi:hypothetical protein
MSTRVKVAFFRGTSRWGKKPAMCQSGHDWLSGVVSLTLLISTGNRSDVAMQTASGKLRVKYSNEVSRASWQLT